MTKYTARVTRIVKRGMHRIGSVTEDGRGAAVGVLPEPDRVEIQVETGANGWCMMIRYTDSGEFCGDTWHKTLRDAFAQATSEFGLAEADFSVEKP